MLQLRARNLYTKHSTQGLIHDYAYINYHSIMLCKYDSCRENKLIKCHFKNTFFQHILIHSNAKKT